MAKDGGTVGVVLAALAGNLAVAAVKFAAFAFTRSTAMLTEAIHSCVDTSDQILLLIGQTRAARPADERHPFGHGMETYFWSFVVALMIFFVGGAASIWQGLQRIAHPAALERPWINYLVLALSAVFEGASFFVAYREFRRTVGRRKIRLLPFLAASKDPGLYSSLMEDGAALAGLAPRRPRRHGVELLGRPPGPTARPRSPSACCSWAWPCSWPTRRAA